MEITATAADEGRGAIAAGGGVGMGRHRGRKRGSIVGDEEIGPDKLFWGE